MEKNYLKISKRSDFKSSKNRALFKFFEILPGFLSWGTLGTVFILSWLAPIIIAIFILAFDLYWFLRISYLSIHQIASYRKMKKHLQINWIEKLNQLSVSDYSLPATNWKDIYHLIT